MAVNGYKSNINRFSTIATDPLRNFRFQAQFTPAGEGTVFSQNITEFSGGFRRISGLEVNVDALRYREGGMNTTMHMIPGMTSFQPIRMERGALYANTQALTWLRGLFAVTAGEGINLGTGTGFNTKDFRCNIKIYVMDHPNADSNTNTPRMGFIVRNAWPTSVAYSGLDAEGGGLLIEDITFVHEGLSMFYTKADKSPVDSSYKLSGV